MGISRSTYYDKPAVCIDDTALVETMAAISEGFEAYGYRRMQAALRHRGLIVNHKKIRRLMGGPRFSMAVRRAASVSLTSIERPMA